MKAIHITNKMNGKMSGMVSINTSPMDNNYCLSMSKVDTNVCGKCYSINMMKMYKNADKCFQRNGDMLSTSLLSDQETPRTTNHTVRFNAHGELINGTHFANLIKICQANPKTTFTLWTKRSDLVSKVIRDFGKPSNLILVKSSNAINVREKLPEHFNKVFTVYSKDNKGKAFINCGEKKCIDCMTCYDLSDRKTYINEVLK
jgi:protein gp37